LAKLNFQQPPQGIGELLPQKLGTDYIGASTMKIRGWSSISNFMTCERLFYYKSIKKLKVSQPSPALDIGILIHECLAAHYASGGARTFKPLEAVQDDRPEIAAEVKRLLYAYFAMYLKEDAETWDIRAVETEIVGKATNHKTGKSVDVYSRLDLLLRKKTKDQPAHPFGPCPDGVYLLDHKCVARMSKDLEDGYRMDGQFLLMAHLWHQNHLDEVYGPLKGFIINIITKTKDVGLKRLTVNVGKEDMERFYKFVEPTIVDMHERIANPEIKNNEDNWRMNFAMCKSPRGFGPCEFLDLCASHGKLEQLYTISKPAK
jgi:hypothetical protein